MLPPERTKRMQVALQGRRLECNAGLLLSFTLSGHLGLRGLVDCHIDLGAAPGRANVAEELLTLVASALAGRASPGFKDSAAVIHPHAPK